MPDRSVGLRVGVALLLGSLLLGGLYLMGEESFLLFHTLVELITIIVDAAIFVLAWNTRSYLGNNYLLFVGIASFFVAGLDLIHAMAYKGIGVFPDTTGNLATQLWVAARYVQSLSLLAAPFFLRRKLNVYGQLAVFAAACLALLLSVFLWHVFPAAYVEGMGLTPFKKVSEYVIALAFAGAIGLLVRERRAFERVVWQYLVAYLVLNIAAELTFTAYVSVFGPTNVVGHLLRLLAAYFLYKAIIQTGLVKPYAVLLRSLKLSEDRLRQDAVLLQARNEELRHSEADLRDHAAALQRRNEELDAYAHTVAHDLKTPLNVIVSASDLVATVPDLPPERAGDLLQRVKTTALSMSTIIDELLLLSEVRKRDVPLEALDMGPIVAGACDRLAELAEEVGGEIRLPESWPVATGYAPWVEQIWVNYITNALKYGGRPPVVELDAAIQPDGMVRFQVRDHGPGLPPGTRDRLFVPFNRLGSLRRAGHGLGLSIVLHIADKLGGQVGAESAPGAGSCFYFTLPRQEGAREADQAAAPPDRRAHAEGGGGILDPEEAALPGEPRQSGLRS